MTTGHKEGDEPEVRQTFLGGEGALASELAAMERAADAAIRAAVGAPGTAERRYRRAELEIFMAMRPEFGPANASLFGKRGRKLGALRERLKLESPPPDRAAALDRFADAVLAAKDALQARGLAVASSVAAGPALWLPEEPAWELSAGDGRRRLTLVFAVPTELSSSASMVRREQPAEPFGALDGALVFTADPMVSGDRDETGELRLACLAALFPDGKNGLGPEAGPGTRAVLRGSRDGADLRRTLRPARE